MCREGGTLLQKPMKLEMTPKPKGNAHSQSKDQTTSSTGNMLACGFLRNGRMGGKGIFFSSWLRLLKPVKFLLLTSMQPNRVCWCMFTCKCHSRDCEVSLMKDAKSALETIYRQVRNQSPGSAHSQSLGKFRSNLNFVVSGMHKPNQPQLQPVSGFC